MPSSIILNPSSKDWSFQPPADVDLSLVLPFHHRLPTYNITPLHSLPSLATELGLGAVLLKDESNRFGLPSFKILGASWAVYRTLCSHLGLEVKSLPNIPGSAAESIQLRPTFEQVRAAAREKDVSIVTATEGNWGRAVGHMSGLLSAKAEIFVSKLMPETTKARIRGEGAVVTVAGDTYEEAADVVRKEAGGNRIMVLDVAEDGYEEIPQWVVEGYSTMLAECDAQVQNVMDGKVATHVVAPVGAGSIAQAVTAHHKDASRPQRSTVIAVEADTAAGLQASIAAGALTSVTTADTIMCGLNCGSLSTSAWKVLGKGVDASATVTDLEAHEAVLELEKQDGLGLKVGPCGAATLAALRRACKEKREELGLGPESVVVLYCTEGRREYAVPGSSAEEH